ncbi:MAG: GNAT family N-acetyltransferase [Proteobacteria bacterium]|nr:GNAT family N-acetyltransferase [Pseudomonadota bacterium]
MAEYAETFEVADRCFEGVDRELAELPGAYAPPRGALYLARDPDGEPLGCIALKPVDEHVCEMKRLYVRPAAQGQGLGRRLAETLIAHARASGAKAMRLDTLSQMQAAQGLYSDLGFQRIAPYNANPTPGIIYLELKL